MIIYNVFIPFYPKKSIKTPFGALIFLKFGQRFPTPAQLAVLPFGSVNQLILLKRNSIRLMSSDQPG
jgi:hypothetical protein